MEELLVVFLAGFAASFVDGALGMGFGPTSSSILLGTSLSPVGISTTVNLAKVATGVTAAIAHWRFDNIDRRLVRRLAIPGCVGALVGVTVLASVDGKQLKPVLAVLLMLMAARILFRFSRPLPKAKPDDREDPDAEPAGGATATTVVAGIGGVTNGLIGAWGPVVTPFLLHHGIVPRVAIGSVNTAEVAVAVIASGSLLAAASGGGIDVGIVLAMMGGGVLAAPVAAWAIKFLPARLLGVLVGALLLLTNIREVTSSWDAIAFLRWPLYGLTLAICAFVALLPRVQHRRMVRERERQQPAV